MNLLLNDKEKDSSNKGDYKKRKKIKITHYNIFRTSSLTKERIYSFLKNKGFASKKFKRKITLIFQFFFETPNIILAGTIQ